MDTIDGMAPPPAASTQMGRADLVLERVLGNRPRLKKLARYSSASVAGVIVGQGSLLFCLLVLEWSAVVSNLVGVTLGSIPNYLINRAWTFNKRGTHSFTREVVPFWLMALLGLVLSTFSVAWAADAYDDNVIAVSLANIGAFGVLWVARFFILDRVLFAPLAEAIEHEIEEHRH